MYVSEQWLENSVCLSFSCQGRQKYRQWLWLITTHFDLCKDVKFCAPGKCLCSWLLPVVRAAGSHPTDSSPAPWSCALPRYSRYTQGNPSPNSTSATRVHIGTHPVHWVVLFRDWSAMMQMLSKYLIIVIKLPYQIKYWTTVLEVTSLKSLSCREKCRRVSLIEAPIAWWQSFEGTWQATF